VLVFNKLDALEKERYPLQLQDTFDLAGVATPRIFLSAFSGDGVAALRQQLARIVSGDMMSAQNGEIFPQSHDAAS
jgi:GTP-binding protein HflX